MEDNIFKLTIIGWWGAYPGAGQATSGYLLQTGKTNILIDCGSGVLGQLQRYLDLEKIDAVVLSHYHHDHVADLGCLQYAARVLMDLGKRELPLAIYGHAQDHHFEGLTYHEFTVGHTIDTQTEVQLGDAVWTFWPNVHPDPCYSMRIASRGKVLAYISDTQWHDGLVEAARDVLPPLLFQVFSSRDLNPAMPPQNLKEYDPEWSRAFLTGSVGASCDHARMLARVKCPVLFTHHFSQMDEQTGHLMGASSVRQVDQIERLVKECVPY